MICELCISTVDASLFTKCGYIKYNPYDASAGGAGPNEARNAKATETANIRIGQRFKRSREENNDEPDESVEIKGRNRIVNGEKVHKHRPWIVAIYRGIGFKVDLLVLITCCT